MALKKNIDTSHLTSKQVDVCVYKGTEAPFSGEYVDHKGNGMYSCVVCGNTLFSSDTKFESGSGWPSFADVAQKGNVELHEDRSHGMVRTEVSCAQCGSHLGHVFDDGPRESTGLRYCVNSAALKFQAQEPNKKG